MASNGGTEPEPSPSRKGLASTFTKSRRKKQKDQSQSPRSSLVIADEGNKNLKRLKDSLDAAVEKIKTRSSGEQGRDSDSDGKSKGDGRGIQDLLRRAKKKTKRALDREPETEPEDGERGRSPAKRERTEGALDSPKSSQSVSTQDMDRSESSLLTYDSETES